MLEKNTDKSGGHFSEMLFNAYEGDEPYIFVSYAHADADLVFPEIKRLHDAGLNIWHDQGIAPGNEWTEEIGNALERCSLFIVFISNNSANSVNVRNEINYALNENKPFFSIYLEETDLPPGLKLSMGSLQAILKYTMDDDEYVFRRNKALRQNGFDITSDSVKYVKTPTKSNTKLNSSNTKPYKSNTKLNSSNTKPYESKSKLPYVAIGVIAIIAIIAVVLFASPSTTDVSSSDLTVTITDAHVDEDDWCFVWGEFNKFSDEIELLTVKVEYMDSSGKVINTLNDRVDTSSAVGDEYMLSGKDIGNLKVDKVKVSMIDSNNNVLCSDESNVEYD